MSVSVSIPTTIQIRRGRLLGLVALVAVLAAGVTAVVLTVALDDGAPGTTSSPQSASTRSAAVAQHPGAKATVTLTRAQGNALASMAAPPREDVDPIMSLTPARLAAGALGLGYALPTRQSGPTVASVLASMSPETRRYTRAVMNLTFAQLAAGAAGQP